MKNFFVVKRCLEQCNYYFYDPYFLFQDSRGISEVDVSQQLTELVSSPPRVWIVLMRSGGHFAGAVFRG